MRVAFAAVCREVAFLAYVASEDNLIEVALTGQKTDVAHADFVRGVTAPDITDIVNTNKNAFAGDFQELGGVMTVTQVADGDASGGYAFFAQERDLLQGKLTEVGSVGHDTGTGTALGARRRAENALLRGGDVFSLRSDLANDAGPDIRAIRTVDEVGDDEIR